MIQISKDIYNYYSKPGKLTGLKKYVNDVSKLPSDSLGLVNIVQNLIVHDMWLDRYGVKNNRVQQPGGSCTMESILDIVHKATGKNPFVENEIQHKAIACCREFATMLCAFFRAKNVPARARCGFATYLADEGKYEDHWVCEVYINDKWVMIDPQIDSFQLDFIQSWVRKQTKINLDYKNMILELNPMNILERDFMVAGKAWEMSRRGEMDANNFGIGVNPKKYNLKSLSGIWFIRGNLIRDFLSLNKIEIDPFVEGIEKRKDYWDNWKIMVTDDEYLTEADWELLDTIASLTLNPDKNFDKIQDFYKNNVALHPPIDIFI